MRSIKILSFLAIILLIFSLFIILKGEKDDKKERIVLKSSSKIIDRSIILTQKNSYNEENITIKRDKEFIKREWYFKAYQLYKNKKYFKAYAIIKKKQKLKEFEKAISFFEKYIKKNRKEAVAYEFLSYLYLFKKEYNRAIDILELGKKVSKEREHFLERMFLTDLAKLFQYKIDNLEANRKESILYYYTLYRLYLFDEAVEFFKNLRPEERDKNFIREIVRFNIEKNNYNKAIKFLEDIGSVDTPLYKGLLSLKELLEDLDYQTLDENRLSKLISTFDKLNGVVSNKKVEEIAKEFVKREPENSYAHLFLSFSKIYTKDIEGAIENSKKSISLNPKEGINYLILSLLEISKNNFNDAEKSYQKIENDEVVFDKSLNKQKAMDTIMKYLFSKGEYQKVLDYYTKIEDKKLISKRGIVLVSKIYIQRKEFQKAIDFIKKYDGENSYLLNKSKENIETIKYYQKAIREEPKNSKLYLDYLDKNLLSKEEQKELIKKAIKENPSNPLLYTKFAKYLTKVQLREISLNHLFLDSSPYTYFDEKEIVALYKKAIELEPNNYYNYKKLADIYYHKENYREAQKYYELAKELKPNATFNALVNIYIQNEEFDKILALNNFDGVKREIINLTTQKDAKYYYNLAIYYYTKNRLKVSLKNYQKARELNKDILIVE